MPFIDSYIDEDVSVIVLNRPSKLNAWTSAMQADLVSALDAAEDDAEISATIVTGAGSKAFCAGQDLDEASRFTADDIGPWLVQLQSLYERPLRSRKPCVAALNGLAVGSGYQFAMLFDARIAHEDVLIGQPEVNSGIPSITGYHITMLSLGHSRTTELMLSGRLMEAEEALRIGLIHRVVSRQELLACALETARSLAMKPAHAVAATKERIYQQVWPGIVESFAAAEEIDRREWERGEPQHLIRRFARPADPTHPGTHSPVVD
jgi:enoyl-CoA hydratase/carnithine racemase